MHSKQISKYIMPKVKLKATAAETSIPNRH